VAEVDKVADEPPLRITASSADQESTLAPTTAQVTTTTIAQETTTTVPPMKAVDACAALGDGLTAAFETSDLPDAGAALEALARVVDDLHDAAVVASSEVRSVVELVAQVYDVYERGGALAVERAQATGNAEVAAMTDELVRLSHGAFFNPYGLATGMTDLVEACPQLSVDVGVDELTVVTDPFPRMRELAARLAEPGPPEIATDYLPPGVLDLTDRDMTVALSGLQDAYTECLGDVHAVGYGDNAGCDTLLASCEGRDLLACNDLYWASAPGSDYEQFAATCGSRTEFGGRGFAGFCEELG
jgi:hypothetical protein